MSQCRLLPHSVEHLGKLSIIIPAYNEGERLSPTLTRVVGWAESALAEYEVLVVDDGSQDNTIEVARAFGDPVRVLENGRNRGKGYSVRHGVLASTGDSVLFSDADLSTPIEECVTLSSALPAADIAIGSRAMARSLIEKRQPFYREAMGKVFNKIVQMLAVDGIADTQCGFKLFRGDVARELLGAITIFGFAFDVEVLYLARQRGYKIAEVPVRWVNDERTRVNAVLDSSRMLRDVMRIRMTHGRGGRR